MNEFEKQYYESEAFWDEHALADPANSKRIEYTTKLVPEDVQSVADIGCGNGLILKRLLMLRPELVTIGVDRSQEALRHVPGNKLIGDATEIPIADRMYDCVICSQVLEHIPVPSYQKALSELARVAKQYVIISVPFAEDLLAGGTSCPCCGSRFNRDLHLRSYSWETVEHLLDDFGFEQVQCENLVKSQAYLGLSYIQRWRAGKQPLKFESPICPICGYTNPHFGGNAQASLPTRAISQGGAVRKVKDLLKAIWPKRTVDGYWIVSLYRRKDPAPARSLQSSPQ